MYVCFLLVAYLTHSLTPNTMAAHFSEMSVIGYWSIWHHIQMVVVITERTSNLIFFISTGITTKSTTIYSNNYGTQKITLLNNLCQKNYDTECAFFNCTQHYLQEIVFSTNSPLTHQCCFILTLFSLKYQYTLFINILFCHLSILFLVAWVFTRAQSEQPVGTLSIVSQDSRVFIKGWHFVQGKEP
jgi:hypothetical protein